MWLNPQKTVDLVTFTEKNFNGKSHFLYSANTGHTLISTALIYI